MHQHDDIPLVINRLTKISKSEQTKWGEVGIQIDTRSYSLTQPFQKHFYTCEYEDVYRNVVCSAVCNGKN